MTFNGGNRQCPNQRIFSSSLEVGALSKSLHSSDLVDPKRCTQAQYLQTHSEGRISYEMRVFNVTRSNQNFRFVDSPVAIRFTEIQNLMR
ncbi:hypothetical protein YC2023_102714 [Brassica napus]